MQSSKEKKLNGNHSKLEEIFAKTNGVLFPGGNEGIDPDDIYAEEGEILWSLAKEANDSGNYYPIWGTCLGFEEMAVLETGSGDVISQNAVATGIRVRDSTGRKVVFSCSTGSRSSSIL